jgi:Predicted sugar phosphate isomerase involved in capsule formation
MPIKRNLELIITELKELYDHMGIGGGENLVRLILDADSVFLAGAGRSGLFLRGFAMRLMHMSKPAFVVGEVVTPAIQAGDLLLIGSGSGETASLKAMAERAKAIGAKVALVSSREESSIAKMADLTVVLETFSPKVATSGGVQSAQPMANLFEQGMFLFFDALTMELMSQMNLTSEVMFKRHANLE